MVAEALDTNITYQSTLDTISNILEQLKEKSQVKQKIIIDQQWDRLIEITNEQNELLTNLENNQAELDKVISVYFKDSQKQSKHLFAENINQYQEIERINARMLNDHLFVAQEKVKNLFRRRCEQKTYRPDMKKESNLFQNNPAIFDKVI
jgi:hypothetical protein